MKKGFSKKLLVQESALIWVISLSFVALAFMCVMNGYLGSLPWLTCLVGFPWTAYGVSQAMYYNKSKAENSQGGIVYDTAMAEYAAAHEATLEEPAYEEFFPDESLSDDPQI